MLSLLNEGSRLEERLILIRLQFLLMTELVKSPIGDFWDWDAIATCARELTEIMKL